MRWHKYGIVGNGPRYMICVTHFCTLRESKTHSHAKIACKNVRQNLIPRATAYGIVRATASMLWRESSERVLLCECCSISVAA